MKKFDKVDFIMVFAIMFFILIGTLSVVNAQTKIVGTGFTIESDEQYTTIVFEDGSKNKLYQNTEDGGVELYYVPMGELVLNTKEYLQFKKDVKKASKRSEVEITRDKYTINSYTWSDDSIYFLNNRTFAVGEIFLTDINKFK